MTRSPDTASRLGEAEGLYMPDLITKMSHPFDDIDDIFSHIQNNIAQTIFRGETQRFLRKPAFDEVTAEHVIQLVIKEDEALYVNNAQFDKLVAQILKNGKRLFATCVQGGLPMTCLKLLLENGLTDAKMPLSKEDCPGKTFKRGFVSSFVPNQALFNTAYFHLDRFQDLTGLTKPIDYDENKLIGKGAFGSVYRIKIHADHRSFESGNLKDEFAMKVTQQKGTRELPYHEAMAGISDPHLVKCLTSFTFASQYHMIYEKASSNLEEFMKAHSSVSSRKLLTVQYLAQQLVGVLGAVFVIHNQLPSEDGPNRLEVPKSGSQKSGYLHDIKPDNLLVFNYDQKPWFRLSDFSCAKVADFVATVSGLNRQSWQSTGKSGTPIYRAPESTTDGKTSRPYDIWSLGCVFLEVLVWYIDGYEALQAFRKSRIGLVKPKGIEDEGFYYTNESGNNPKAHLRDQVVHRLETIKSRCSGPLRMIADIIPQMLEIEAKKRPTAEQLVNRLRAIGKASPPAASLLTQRNLVVDKGISLPVSPTYSSESDSDTGPMINIQVQRPTDP